MVIDLHPHTRYNRFVHELTAGSAKNEMPNKAQQEAIIFPGQVIGTVSP